jgi:hypothetical protein
MDCCANISAQLYLRRRRRIRASIRTGSENLALCETLFAFWHLAFDKGASGLAAAIPVFDATKHRAHIVISLCGERDGRGQ